MSILCTFPGKYGDLLWTLPTLRALARRTGEAIDLLTSADMASVCPLIAQQGYIGHCFADPQWVRVHIDTEDRHPPANHLVAGRYDHIFHLGYRGWPQRALPFEIKDGYNDQILNASPTQHYLLDEELDLGTPWITVASWKRVPHPVVIGFSDDHFELKFGVVALTLANLCRPGSAFVLAAPGSRWENEAGMELTRWEENARRITAAAVFLGCNSGLHVLACAIGRPVVMMEPSEARWNPIFFPLGTTGPQVTLVLGNDGKPTWDARHVADTLQRVLTSTPVRTDQERLS